MNFFGSRMQFVIIKGLIIQEIWTDPFKRRNSWFCHWFHCWLLWKLAYNLVFSENWHANQTIGDLFLVIASKVLHLSFGSFCLLTTTILGTIFWFFQSAAPNYRIHRNLCRTRKSIIILYPMQRQRSSRPEGIVTSFRWPYITGKYVLFWLTDRAWFSMQICNWPGIPHVTE